MTLRETSTGERRLRKTLLIVAAVVLTLFGVATAYTLFYSMQSARPLEVAGAPAGPTILIATQGSAFKDAVVAGLLDHLKQRSAHVRVIDISALSSINESDWDALVIFHTWEMRKPPAPVKAFVDRTQQRNKLVVLTTSGSGYFKLEGVDAISTASKMLDVPARVSEIAKKVDAILNAEHIIP